MSGVRSYIMRSGQCACLLMAIAPLPTASLQALNLAWDASTGATGYKLYYGSSPLTYTYSVDCGNSLSNSLTLSAGTYYFAVSAYNGAKEGVKSPELQVVVTQPVVVKLTLEYSTNNPAGPYRPTNSWFFTNAANGQQQFYRAVLSISQ